MYIFIFEDGTIRKNEKLNDDDIISVEDGYLEIINITNPLKPLYCLGKNSWILITNV